MKGVIVSEPLITGTKKFNRKSFSGLLFKALIAGLYGFFAFFTVLLLIEFFTGLFESKETFEISIYELQLSLFGFMGGLVVKLFESKVRKGWLQENH